MQYTKYSHLNNYLNTLAEGLREAATRLPRHILYDAPKFISKYKPVLKSDFVGARVFLADILQALHSWISPKCTVVAFSVHLFFLQFRLVLLSLSMVLLAPRFNIKTELTS